MTSIFKILTSRGPMISSRLATELAQTENISVNTASQQISRSKDILKIKGFFKSQQSLIYLQKHADENLVYPILSDMMYEHGLKYWYTLNALKMHNGVVNQTALECYTNYPIMPLKGHLPFAAIMQRFVSEGIVIFSNEQYLLSPKIQLSIGSTLTNLALDTIKNYILESLHKVFRNTGLISFETGELFGEYGKFRWAFKGVSPVMGLRNDKNGLGFLVADILVGTPIYKKDVLFFVAKLNHIKAYKGAPRLIPFFIVDDLEKDALDYLKQQGIVVGFIRELLGEKYAETLKELVTILTNAAASLKKDPEKYLDLIKQLKIYNEGLLGNIRGTLFEYAVGHIHVLDCQNIEIGKEILDVSGSKHEMDVVAVYSNRIVIAECKGKKSAVDQFDIDYWLDEAIPSFRRWVDKQEIYRNKQLEFEYWSTGGFTDEAKRMLDDAASSFRKNKISYYGAKEIRQKAVDIGNKKLKEALDNYFLKPSV